MACISYSVMHPARLFVAALNTGFEEVVLSPKESKAIIAVSIYLAGQLYPLVDVMAAIGIASTDHMPEAQAAYKLGRDLLTERPTDELLGQLEVVLRMVRNHKVMRAIHVGW